MNVILAEWWRDAALTALAALVVELRREKGHVEVRVQDNGAGLRPDQGRKSYGLLGKRERARTLGGDARIYSPDSGGTIVEIRMPVEAEARSGVPA